MICIARPTIRYRDEECAFVCQFVLQNEVALLRRELESKDKLIESMKREGSVTQIIPHTAGVLR